MVLSVKPTTNVASGKEAGPWRHVNCLWGPVLGALAIFVMRPNVLEAQSSCACLLGPRMGFARYGESDRHVGLMPSIVVMFRDHAFIRTEYELSFLSYRTPSGPGIPVLGFASEVQFSPPVRFASPHIGVGLGTMVTIGQTAGVSSRFAKSATASAGMRVRIADRWSLHALVRRYWAGDSVSKTTDLITFGLLRLL